MVGVDAERNGIAKQGAKLVHAVSNANVPKLTLIMGGSFGAGNYGMCGRAFDPRFLFMWPNAKISVMGGEQAANVLTDFQKNKLSADDVEPFRESMKKKYENQASCYYSSARLWDDGVIEPKDSRRILGLALFASLNSKIEESPMGVFRM